MVESQSKIVALAKNFKNQISAGKQKLEKNKFRWSFSASN